MAILPPFDPDDIVPDLEARHRAAMLDLVLAWGSLDCALGILLSTVRDVPLDEGAELIGRRPSSAKLAEIIRLLANTPGGADAARIMDKHRESYGAHAQPRNRIAHSRCVGVWSRDQDYIVFATFERVADGELAVDRIPIQEMQRATRWGNAMRDMALNLADVLSPEV